MVPYAMHSELRRVVDTIPELIWTAAADGSVEFVNQRWSEYTGLRLEQARGFGWHAATWPEDLQRLAKDWARGTTPLAIEAHAPRGYGLSRWLPLRSRPLGRGGREVAAAYRDR